MNIGHNSRLVAIVDDDESVQRALQDLIESDGLSAMTDTKTFLLVMRLSLPTTRCDRIPG